MTRAARAIKTHSHGLVDPLAAGELVGEGAADVDWAVGDGDGGAVVTSGVGAALVGAADCVGRLGGEIVMP
jgi:hypothetical protein